VLLDLKKANRSQLVEAGVPVENIFARNSVRRVTSIACSATVKEGASSGRLMSAIGIRR